MGTSVIEAGESRWHGLYKIGGVAALVTVAIIPITIFVYVSWPPPDTAIDYFMLFQNSKLLGLLGMDLLYLLSNFIAIPIFLALYIALRRTSESVMVIATILGFVALVALVPARPAFEMLSLSDQYAAATTDAQRAMFLAAGETMLAMFSGTAFNVHYVLGSAALLIISIVMLRSDVFSKVTAYVGIVSNVLVFGLYVPGIGVLLSIISVVGLAIWNVLIALRFFRLAVIVE